MKKQYNFEYILAIDSETTGLVFDNDNPVYNQDKSIYHQAVSWGVMVLDGDFNILDKLYIEIKYNKTSKKQLKENESFGLSAEKIHGLSFEYLEKHGLTEIEAIEKIGNLILKYWGPTGYVTLLGHNVASFDVFFLRDMFTRHDMRLNISNRMIDTFSIGYTALRAYNSNQLFELCGFDDRGKHNSLDDIEMTVKSIQLIDKLFKRLIK